MEKSLGKLLLPVIINITGARRCERKLVEVKNNYQHIDDNCLIFINRLSDYLFTLARYDSYIKGLTENIYKKSTILQLCNEENK